MFFRQESDESTDSTEALLGRHNSTTISFFGNPNFPSTSTTTSRRGSGGTRSQFFRDHSTSVDSNHEDDEQHGPQQQHSDPLRPVQSQSTLTALPEEDETTTTASPPNLTSPKNLYFPLHSDDAHGHNSDAYRPTYMPTFSTSVAWERTKQQSPPLDNSQSVSDNGLEPTVDAIPAPSEPQQQQSEQSTAATPPRSDSSTNLRRQKFVRKLSNFGTELVNTAAEVAATTKIVRPPKLGDLFRGKQVSLDLGGLSFDANSDREEALNQRIKEITGQLLGQYYARDMSQDNEEKGTFQVLKGLVSKGIGKLVFWVVISVLAVLTLKDVVELSVDYSEDPKQSDMNILFNESMTMPNITFCMSRSQAWSHFAINPNESTEAWNDIVQEGFDNMTTPDSFLATPWNYRLIMEAYEVVATLNSMERETTPHGAFRSMTVFRTKSRLEEKRATVRKWLDAIAKRNVSFEQLTQKVGTETIKHSMQRFQRTTYDENLSIKTRFRTSWISMMQFCFQPWFDTDNFPPIKDQGNFFTMVLSHDPAKLAGQSVECMSVDFHGRPSSLSRFMEGKGRIRDGFNDELCVGMVHEVTVEVKAQYIMLENDDPGTACNHVEKGEHNEFDCRSKCRMDMIRDVCKCTALTLSYLVPPAELEQFPLCDYTKCVVDVQSQNFTDAECSDKCYRDCNQIRYEIDHETKGRSVRPDISTMYLNWGSFEFLTLTQERIWSVPTFIAALGGSIGMWLGLSILSLIQGASYVFFMIRESKKKRKTVPLTQNPFSNPFKAKLPSKPPPAYEEYPPRPPPNNHTNIQVE